MQIPTESKECLVLIRQNSELRNQIFRMFGCQGCQPVYAIYEYDRCFVGYELRFGDGSGLSISKNDHAALVEVPGVKIDALFN